MLDGSGNCSALTSKSGVPMRLCIIERKKKNQPEVGQSCDWGRVRAKRPRRPREIKRNCGQEAKHTLQWPLKKASGRGNTLSKFPLPGGTGFRRPVGRTLYSTSDGWGQLAILCQEMHIHQPVVKGVVSRLWRLRRWLIYEKLTSLRH